MRIACYCLGMIGCLAWPGAAAAFEARINRPIVQESLAQGEVASGSIQVENLASTPLEVSVYLEDWEYLEGGTGDKKFSVPGSSPWSASRWITYHPKQLRLPAKGVGVVEYTIQVPLESSGGRYAVLFFESKLASTAPNTEGVNVQYLGRLGSLFNVEVTGTIERTGEIQEVIIGRPDDSRPLTLGYTFLNTGNIAIRPKAYFNIIDASGRYFGRGELDQLYTFPHRGGSTTTEWIGQLPVGAYTVLLTVDLGDNQVLVAERPLEVRRDVRVEAVRLGGTADRGDVLDLYNAGHVSVTLSGSVRVQSLSGQLRASGEIARTLLSANERGTVAVEGLEGVPPGAYRCAVDLTFDGGVLQMTLPCERF